MSNRQETEFIILRGEGNQGKSLLPELLAMQNGQSRMRFKKLYGGGDLQCASKDPNIYMIDIRTNHM